MDLIIEDRKEKSILNLTQMQEWLNSILIV